MSKEITTLDLGKEVGALRPTFYSGGNFTLSLTPVPKALVVGLWNRSKLCIEDVNVAIGDFRVVHSHLGFVGYITQAEWEAVKHNYTQI